MTGEAAPPPPVPARSGFVQILCFLRRRATVRGKNVPWGPPILDRAAPTEPGGRRGFCTVGPESGPINTKCAGKASTIFPARPWSTLTSRKISKIYLILRRAARNAQGSMARSSDQLPWFGDCPPWGGGVAPKVRLCTDIGGSPLFGPFAGPRSRRAKPPTLQPAQVSSTVCIALVAEWPSARAPRQPLPIFGRQPRPTGERPHPPAGGPLGIGFRPPYLPPRPGRLGEARPVFPAFSITLWTNAPQGLGRFIVVSFSCAIFLALQRFVFCDSGAAKK